MCTKVKLINHDCLPILMLLYIMLAYLMLFATLSNAVCLHNAFFSLSFAIDFCKCFLFFGFVLVYWHTVCLFQIWVCIMRSVFNLLVFPNSMFTSFFVWKGYVLSWEIALNNNLDFIKRGHDLRIECLLWCTVHRCMHLYIICDLPRQWKLQPIATYSISWILSW